MAFIALIGFNWDFLVKLKIQKMKNDILQRINRKYATPKIQDAVSSSSQSSDESVAFEFNSEMKTILNSDLDTLIGKQYELFDSLVENHLEEKEEYKNGDYQRIINAIDSTSNHISNMK